MTERFLYVGKGREGGPGLDSLGREFHRLEAAAKKAHYHILTHVAPRVMGMERRAFRLLYRSQNLGRLEWENMVVQFT